jgi:hypothetical protein
LDFCWLHPCGVFHFCLDAGSIETSRRQCRSCSAGGAQPLGFLSVVFSTRDLKSTFPLSTPSHTLSDHLAACGGMVPRSCRVGHRFLSQCCPANVVGSQNWWPGLVVLCHGITRGLGLRLSEVHMRVSPPALKDGWHSDWSRWEKGLLSQQRDREGQIGLVWGRSCGMHWI